MYEKRYFTKNKKLKFFLYIVGFFTLFIRSIFIKKTRPKKINKLLVANNGHLGDIVILIPVINLLRENHNIQIDLVTGSWNKVVLDYYKDTFDNVIFVDHWARNRAKETKGLKLRKYLNSFFKSLFEIRKIKYDIAIDTYHFFPNMSLLLFLSNIKYRIGYQNSGFEYLYNEFIIWESKNQSISMYHLNLFKKVFSFKSNEIYYKSNEIESLAYKEYGNYVVFHPGTGDEIKKWPNEKWKELIKMTLLNYDNIILLGVGKEEAEICKSLVIDSRVINMANKYNLLQTSLLLKDAKLLVCLDSFIAHFAAQFRLKTVIISTGINDLVWWKPINTNSIQIIANVICSPCYKPKGCADMNCIRDIDAKRVFKVLEETENVC